MNKEQIYPLSGVEFLKSWLYASEKKSGEFFMGVNGAELSNEFYYEGKNFSQSADSHATAPEKPAKMMESKKNSGT